MPLLFSYGTLQEARVQRATFGRLLEGRPDVLAGYEKTKVAIADPEERKASGRTHYDNVRFTGNANARVAGTVFEVTDAELDAADAYERDAYYERSLVSLESGTQAWVYISTARDEFDLAPDDPGCTAVMKVLLPILLMVIGMIWVLYIRGLIRF